MLQRLTNIHQQYCELLPIFTGELFEEIGFSVHLEHGIFQVSSVGVVPFELNWMSLDQVNYENTMNSEIMTDHTYFQAIIDWNDGEFMCEFTANYDGFLCRVLHEKPGEPSILMTSNESFLQYRFEKGLFQNESFAIQSLIWCEFLMEHVRATFLK